MTHVRQLRHFAGALMLFAMVAAITVRLAASVKPIPLALLGAAASLILSCGGGDGYGIASLSFKKDKCEVLRLRGVFSWTAREGGFSYWLHASPPEVYGETVRDEEKETLYSPKLTVRGYLSKSDTGWYSDQCYVFEAPNPSPRVTDCSGWKRDGWPSVTAGREEKVLRLTAELRGSHSRSYGVPGGRFVSYVSSDESTGGNPSIFTLAHQSPTRNYIDIFEIETGERVLALTTTRGHEDPHCYWVGNGAGAMIVLILNPYDAAVITFKNPMRTVK